MYFAIGLDVCLCTVHASALFHPRERLLSSASGVQSLIACDCPRSHIRVVFVDEGEESAASAFDPMACVLAVFHGLMVISFDASDCVTVGEKPAIEARPVPS